MAAWNGNKGIVYEVDPRHAEIVVEQLKLEEAKVVATPGTKEEGITIDNCEDKLDDEGASKYLALVARCNYFSPDRPDISHCVEELARHMAFPSKGNWMQLKRFGRYFKGRPRMCQVFEWQKVPQAIRTFSDADRAGCKQIRKSTIGGCVMLGKHTIKSWSRTQSLVAFSSGESELYATLKAAAESLGMISLLKDLGWHVAGEIWGDTSAALGIINRRGLGKTRHIDTGLLWIQQTAAEKRLNFHKVLGKVNPTDLFTKHLDQPTIDKHTSTMAFEITSGRAKEAPKLHTLQNDEHELCPYVRDVCEALNENKSATRYCKKEIETVHESEYVGVTIGVE